MSSIYVTKVLSSTTNFAGRKWHYNFRELPIRFEEATCQRNANSISRQYSEITNLWDSDKNSEWICRIYLAAKMVLNATLQLMTLDYSNEKNLRCVNPYLRYYSVLSACRCVVFTLPTESWDEGKITELTHSKTINVTFDYLSKFDKKLCGDFKHEVQMLKAQRELISYRAPSSGDYGINEDLDLESLCAILVEIAQFNSEILETSIHKNASKDAFNFKKNYIDQLSTIFIGDLTFKDSEDWYRLDYLRRKWPAPPNILHIMTEGHTEDFFGAWEPDEEDDEVFSTGAPSNWQSIFDIP